MLRYFVRRIVSPGDSIGVPILFFQYPSGLQDSTLMNESGSALPSRNHESRTARDTRVLPRRLLVPVVNQRVALVPRATDRSPLNG